MSDEQPRQRQRPTHTVIITGVGPTTRLLDELVARHCTFTVEYHEGNTWHVGVFADGLRVATDTAGRIYG